jgi:hypothetical protein
MAASYLPIYKAKKGELQALAQTDPRLKKQVLPLFEVCRIGKNVREAKRFKDCPLVRAYLDETAERIADVWKGRSAMVDAFQWSPESVTETGEHILPYIYSRLAALQVDVIPVIGYDRWDSPVYRLAMEGLDAEFYCLRLDSHAQDDAEDPEYFQQRLTEILEHVGTEPARCAVLIDFGDVTSVSIQTMLDRAEAVMQVCQPLGFSAYATAACSLPPSIDGAVKEQNSSGKVVRKEMLVWKALRTTYIKAQWIFGDYGVRGPNTADEAIAPHMNGKIRHTIDQAYFVVRGHSIQYGAKGAQMYGLAKTVVNSIHFMGEDFSWGDQRILECSDGQFKGNSTDWIAIDTNHHLAWVTAEVREFELKLAAAGNLGQLGT